MFKILLPTSLLLGLLAGSLSCQAAISDAEAVNRAGMQRMLSQRIAKNYLMIGTDTRVDLAASQLESLLVRATTIGVPAAGSASQREVMLRQIQTFILDELHNPQLSAKYICRHLQISRSHLFAVLADAGTSFAAHVRDARLRHSLNQLRDPRLNDLPIGEIALRVGFKSHESFARAFRRAYGTSPGAIRAGDQETN